MGSDNNEFSNQSAGAEDQSSSSVSVQSSGNAVGFYIEKFPKEFKKGFIRPLDKKFAIILFLSFVINIGTLLYLENNLSYEVDSKAITKLQQEYANLLLDREQSAARANGGRGGLTSDYQRDSKMLTGLSQLMDNLSVDFFNSIESFQTPAEPMGAQGTAETWGYTREEMSDKRSSLAQQRLGSREGLSQAVSSVGLLGLISSRSNNLDYEYVQDLLEYASNNSEELTQVLSKLRTIEIPRYGNSAYLGRVGAGSEREATAGLRGNRVIADNEISKLVNDMQPLNKPKTETISRNIQLEKIPTSFLDKTSTAGKTGVQRTNEDVIRVVKSHMRALQDCFKQELKTTPDLKGKIVVRFTINPAGQVIQSSVVSSTLNHPPMENCILKRINQWKNFPPCDPAFGNKSYRQSFKFGM